MAHRISGTRLSGSNLSGSYDDDVRMMEKFLDARDANKGGSQPFQALKFGAVEQDAGFESSGAAVEKRNIRRSSGSGNAISFGTSPSSSSTTIPIVLPPGATERSSASSSSPAAAALASSASPPKVSGAASQKQKQQQQQKGQKQDQQPPTQKGKQSDASKQPQKQKDGESTSSDTPQPSKRKQSVSGPAAAAQASTASTSSGQNLKVSKPTQYDDPKQRQKAQKKQILTLELSSKQVPLFAHLPQYERPKVSVTERLMATAATNQASPQANMHPKIIRLGLKYVNRQLQGSNARTIGMLKAFKHFIRDHENTSGKTLAIDLDLKLRPVIQFLIDCRPLAVGMGNAIKYLKRQIGATTSMSDENEVKQFLISEIDRYIQERIVYADEAICVTTADQIQDGDVILTYASSHVVESSFKRAKASGKNFQVIIVDSRPRFEGKTLLARLAAVGIPCSYVLLNAVSYIIKGVDKVIMGAHALLSNGQVYSRCGTAVVSMVANAHNIPVLVCCETYKFADRVQVDAISQNELDDPDSLLGSTLGDEGAEDKLKDWKSNDSLKLLNLVYDLTPMEFVSMVISEVGMTPPTSVPVVIREYQLRTQDQIQQDRAFY